MSVKKTLTLGYCPMGNGDSISPFNKVFDNKVDISKTMAGVDAVVFWGGTDIHPNLYNEDRHPRSQAGREPSARDEFEWKAMRYCQVNDIPMIGVCRGAQLMTAFVGGFLIQDVNGHHLTHDMQTNDGSIIATTSCHHQMMYPYDVEHELLAWAVPRQSGYYHGDSYTPLSCMNDKREPEVVYYPQIRGLAIQGHPEWAVGTQFADYCNELIKSKLLDEVTA